MIADNFSEDSLKLKTNIKETNARRVISCGILETPRFGRKSNFFFTPGTRVNFECNQDFILTGDKRRICEDNGRWNLPDYGYTECLRKQEYSARTLGATWGIISAVMLPIVVVLICIGWRILKRRKEEEKEENDFLTVRSRPIDPDESVKINSDDESIPYKKDVTEDTPEPTVPEEVTDNSAYPYGQSYDQQLPPPPPPQEPQQQARPWTGETEIN